MFRRYLITPLTCLRALMLSVASSSVAPEVALAGGPTSPNHNKSGLPHFSRREVGSSAVPIRVWLILRGRGRIFIFRTCHSFTFTGPASPNA